jgi:hypothetical protein
MTTVSLHVYDLSQGLAAQFSQMFIGRRIEGVWHTGVVAFGYEYYFGGGIQKGVPLMTPYGRPVRVESLGTTTKTQEELHEFLRSISSQFSAATYDLLNNNCNNFSNAVSNFLLGSSIPNYITGLPAEFLATPFGQMIAPSLSSMQQNMLASIEGQSNGSFLPSSGSVSSYMSPANSTINFSSTATSTSASTNAPQPQDKHVGDGLPETHLPSFPIVSAEKAEMLQKAFHSSCKSSNVKIDSREETELDYFFAALVTAAVKGQLNHPSIPPAAPAILERVVLALPESERAVALQCCTFAALQASVAQQWLASAFLTQISETCLKVGQPSLHPTQTHLWPLLINCWGHESLRKEVVDLGEESPFLCRLLDCCVEGVMNDSEGAVEEGAAQLMHTLCATLPSDFEEWPLRLFSVLLEVLHRPALTVVTLRHLWRALLLIIVRSDVGISLAEGMLPPDLLLLNTTDAQVDAIKQELRRHLGRVGIEGVE